MRRSPDCCAVLHGYYNIVKVALMREVNPNHCVLIRTNTNWSHRPKGKAHRYLDVELNRLAKAKVLPQPKDMVIILDPTKATTADYDADSKNQSAKRIIVTCAIHLAVYQGHIELVKLLIEHGARLDTPCRLPMLASVAQSVDGFRQRGTHILVTPLYVAIARGHGEIAKLVLHHGSPLNLCLSSHIISPLHLAVTVKGREMTELVLAQISHTSRSLSQLDCDGFPPMWLAYISGNFAALQVLQKCGQNIDYDLAIGYTLLVDACSWATLLPPKFWSTLVPVWR
ncbi:ankyrin repeat-containing domain protein [Podospora didyma]|uniref:Ankyrin repeat-containing domain protein n=1 Tax=Podospora didyma TaxID=330526 RepID=A0AAE0K5X1_9PEZI|nr:ankyrin repeat-containing domain protein [Podospora didyma]